MTKWAVDRIMNDQEGTVFNRVSDGMDPDTLAHIEDFFAPLIIQAWDIVFVIAPSVAVSGRGSQPGIEN